MVLVSGWSDDAITADPDYSRSAQMKQDYNAEMAAQAQAQRRVADLLGLCFHHDYCPGNHDNRASDYWCPHDDNCDRIHA